MKDKKITILQILIGVIIIVCILVAIILIVSNNIAKKTEMGQVNSKNAIKEEVSNLPTEPSLKNKEYIPNATDEEKIQRGEELFGNKICSRSEYIVNKIKKEEWNVADNNNIDEEHQHYDNLTWYREGKCRICGKVYNSVGANVLCDECAKITNRCMDCGKLKLNKENDRISLEELQNKENILECTQDYWQSNGEIDSVGAHIRNYLNITDDYYIYYCKCESSDMDGLNFYKKLDEQTAKNIINNISTLKDEKLDEKCYKITSENLSISITENEISRILKKYGINIML